jgi:uncharacterized protein YkwD
MRRRPSSLRPTLRAILTATTLGLALATGLLPLRPAIPTAAGTAESMAASILSSINHARAQRGLASLQVDSRLSDLAGDRAATLASIEDLSHEAPGCLRCQIEDRGIAWNLFGEVLASNTWPWGAESARVIFESWRDSPSHWDILMGPDFDRIGVGVAQSATGGTYSSAVLVDAPGGAPAPTPRPRPASTPRPAPRAEPPPTPAPTPAPQRIPGPTIRIGLIPL